MEYTHFAPAQKFQNSQRTPHMSPDNSSRVVKEESTTSSDLICTIVQRHIRSQSLLRTHEHPGDALVNEMVEFFRAAREDDLLDDIELQGLIRRAVKLASHFCDLVERKSTAGEAA